MMKTNLTFDFTVDKETNTVSVKREFGADLITVWNAFTKPELLDLWWAPKPWVSRTKYMDFKVGGKRLYAMCGPNGEEHWALADYTSISPMKNFKFLDAFCDENENISSDMPRSAWSIDFEKGEGTTLVQIDIKHKCLSDLEMIIKLGFKEGFTIALDGLDKTLTTIK